MLAKKCWMDINTVKRRHMIHLKPTFPVDVIKDAFAVGARAFGENRIQEGADSLRWLVGLSEPR